jgi:mannitol/fructose-specific phosphotransferase system IIA component (Ntr-type)/galactitol-specific phosphotransferase system IIB component
VQYICSLLLAHGVEPYLKVANNKDQMLLVTNKMIRNMSELLDVDLTDNDLLGQALIAHIVPMIHRLRNNILIINPLRDSIKKQYSTMFTLTKFVIGDIEREYAVSLTEDEVTFLTIHFQLAFERIRVTKHILIVCHSGLATSELIFNRVKQNVSADVILEITSSDKLHKASLANVDLIISTIPLDTLPVEIMYVSALPTPEEVGKISAYISNLSQHEKSFHSKQYQNSTVLSKYLDKDFLYVKQAFESKESILNYLADDYFERGFVTSDFKKCLFEREELGSTGLKTGVAIPHAEPQTVIRTKVTFMALESPIKWGMSRVQLVVLLAIAEEDMTEAKELIASIYDLFNSPEEINWVVESKNKEELYERLLRGGTGHVF